MTLLDPDRTLALAYVPADRRAAVRALWMLDATLGAVMASGGQLMLREIKLAWWREALERLDQAPPPAEPILHALYRDVISGGLSGEALAGLEDGWRILLTPDRLTREDLTAYAGRRGGLLFALTARLLGETDPAFIEGAGAGCALVDLARRSGSGDAEAALAEARERLQPIAKHRWPRRLRPLGMLAALAWRDVRHGSPFEQQGAPARMLRMMALWVTGR